MTTTDIAPVKVGDFFVCSWGYDQTNVDFYKVVGLTPSGKSVKVQQWTSRHVDDCHVVPGYEPRTFIDWSDVTPEMDYWERLEVRKDVEAPVETHRLRTDWSVPAFTVNSYSAAQLWDGKPDYVTPFGGGH